MRKRTVLSMLIFVNAALVAALLMSAYPTPRAYAQGTGLGGNYLIVAGQIRDQFDALYMLDLRSRILHAFMFNSGNKQLEYVDSTSLDRDFRNPGMAP